MVAPKPIVLTQVDAEDYEGLAPQPFVVVGDVPGSGGATGSVSPDADTLALRDGDGKVKTETAADGDDAVNLTQFEGALDLKADLASPTFTGTPAAPTAAVATSTTQVATTAFVQAATKSKTQIAALAAVSAANATAAAADPPTKAEFDVLVTLANANKTAVNAIITALKA